MKKLISILLCMAMLSSIPCVCSAAEGEKTKITVGVSGTAESLAPFITSTNILKMLHGMMHMQLGNVDEEGKLVSNLYTSFENPSDMHYVVTLREDIYDSAGNHITAEDVAYSYATAKAAGTQQTFGYYDNPQAVSEYVFEFDMVTDAISALEQVMSGVNIVSQTAYEGSSDEMSMNPVTCAPYTVREFVPGSHIILDKAQDYWCKDMSELSRDKQTRVDVIEIKFITEAAQLSMALAQNTIDAAVGVNATVAADFETNENYTVEYAPSNLFYNLYFDVREGHVFENELLRKAVLYAIDQDSVMYGALQGAGWVNKAVASRYSADYNPEWDEADYYNTDLEKAKELLAEAGYEPGELTIQLMCQWEQTKPAAEVAQACLEQIGIHSEIICPDTALFSTYQDCTSDVWDINIMFFAAKTLGANSMNAQFNTAVRENGMTFSGIQDEELQRLVEEAISIKTYSKESYDAVQEYIKEKAYAYGLYSPRDGYVFTTQLTEMYVDANGRFLPNACVYAEDYNIYE